MAHGRWKVFFVITLPMISPALVVGLAAGLHPVAGRSGDRQLRLGAGFDHAADGDLLQVRLGVTPEINALATIIVALVTTGIIIAGVFMARQERIRKIDEQMAASSGT